MTRLGDVMERLQERRRIAAAVAAVVLVVLGGWWLVVRPTIVPVGHDQAVAIARDFFASADAHGAGTTVRNVSVTAADLDSDASGRAAWKINIHGDVTEAGSTTPAYTSHMWLYVDAETGAVTVFAQG